MEKVILTKEQAEGIERFKSEQVKRFEEVKKNKSAYIFSDWEKSLLDLDSEELEDALYIGYEVEPEYSAGDWVWIRHRKLAQLTEFITHNDGDTNWAGNVWCDFRKKNREIAIMHNEIKRHATPSEIAEEKERRFWKGLGRNVNDYYVGDIIFYSPTSRYHRITGKYDGYFTNEFGDRCEVEKVKLVCPAENRLDVKTNE